jgi:hypothetical protein
LEGGGNTDRMEEGVIRVEYWERLLSQEQFKGKNMIVGGNLNFTINKSVIRGSTTKPDPLADFFLNKMKGIELVRCGTP